MEIPSESREAKHNLTTRQTHRREAFWQITLPFIIGTLLLVGLSVVVSLGAMGEVRTWGNMSIIWLIFLTFLPGLLFLVILIALVYGVNKISQHLPGIAFRAQNKISMIEKQVTRSADKAVEPIMKVEAARAGLKSIFRK